MEPRSIIGFVLGDAKIMLSEAGRNIAAIRLTSEPKTRPKEIDPSFRVVNVTDKGEEGLVITVCKPL
ncbi:MAG: hypothetical protein GX992_06225 [Clostridium sp.]|nr:hypothetical protein [Clostridium sp.]